MKTGIFLLIIAILIPFALSSCKDSDMAQFGALGKNHDVKLYSGGKLVGEWTSTGNVSNESSSDGYYFEDSQTNKLIEVSGTVIITQIN